jgi:hypothetical protein
MTEGVTPSRRTPSADVRSPVRPIIGTGGTKEGDSVPPLLCAGCGKPVRGFGPYVSDRITEKVWHFECLPDMDTERKS